MTAPPAPPRARLPRDRPVLLVVVHQTSLEHAAAQTRLAVDAGADGVFLINHWTPARDLSRVLAAARAEVGDGPWIGINPLGLNCVTAAQALPWWESLGGRLDGLWCDDAQVDERRAHQVEAAVAAKARAGWDGLYFGGVAFKHQRTVAPGDLEAAAQCAGPHMDVICTSGPGTGQPADIAHLARLAAGAGDTPLAVASGVSIANVDAQLEHVWAVLAATSVSINDTDLDPVAVEALATRIHAHIRPAALTGQLADPITAPTPGAPPP